MTSNVTALQMAKRHSRLARVLLWSIAMRATLSRSYGAERFSAFRNSLGGMLPDAEHTPDVILAACDDGYFTRFGIGFVKSIDSAANSPHGVHLHLLEPSTATLAAADALGGECKNVALTYTVDPCLSAEDLRFRNLYYNAARFVLAPHILSAGVQRLLIVDIDSVMNRSPWPFIDDAPSAFDAAFILRPEKRKPWNKILAAAVLYTARRTSQRFAETYARSILMSLQAQPRYHVDQILPHYLMRLGSAEIVAVPPKIMSYDQDATAAFWTAKGAAKHGAEYLTAHLVHSENSALDTEGQ